MCSGSTSDPSASTTALVGYLLLHRPRTDLEDFAWFVAAMGLHFVVTDHSLREHHKDAYVARGRFLLAGAVVAGVLLGLALEVSETAVVALFAFLAGGVVLNVLKEELPAERQSRYAAFIAEYVRTAPHACVSESGRLFRAGMPPAPGRIV